MERRKLRARIVEIYGTNKALAEKIGASRQTISNVVQGRTTPTRKKLPEWCAALGISPEETALFFANKPLSSEE